MIVINIYNSIQLLIKFLLKPIVRNIRDVYFIVLVTNFITRFLKEPLAINPGPTLKGSLYLPIDHEGYTSFL